MAIKGSEEVILARPGEPGRHGDPGDVETTTLGIFERCVVWPRVSTEVEAEGTVITEGYNIWIPWGVKANRDVIDEAAGVKGTDVVVVRGEEWQVKGTPADQRSMRGKRLGVQMVVGRVA